MATYITEFTQFLSLALGLSKNYFAIVSLSNQLFFIYMLTKLLYLLSNFTPHHHWSANSTTKIWNSKPVVLLISKKYPSNVNGIFIRERLLEVWLLTWTLPVLPVLLCCYTLCPRCDRPPPQTLNYSPRWPQATNRVTWNSSEPHYATELDYSVAEIHQNRSQSLYTEPSRSNSWPDSGTAMAYQRVAQYKAPLDVFQRI